MPVIVRDIPFIGTRKRPATTQTPVVVGPVLIAASYVAETFTLTLTFDRAVNVVGAEVVPETITIFDGVNSTQFLNTFEVYGSGTATLTITMFANDSWSGSGVTMSATNNTGIVDAATDAGWVGATDVALPFA